MTFRRMRGWYVLSVLLATACGGGGGGNQNDDASVGDDGNDTNFDAPPHEPGRFPLHVAGDGSSLVSQNGKPFLLHAEAAWSLIVGPTTTEAEQYLNDRDIRGVDAILLNLIEHKFTTNAPKNAAGDAPFTTANDFTTPNEAYFKHADEIIDRAANHGIAVLLFPSYLGFNGGDEGWFSAMSSLSMAKCRQYGDFVGARYANRTNIIWMWGGDYTPPSGSAGETCMKAIADGIRAANPSALASAHWAPESNSRDESTFASIIDLVGVYTYSEDLSRCRSARDLAPKKPTFLLETTYENEHGAPVSEIRRQQWWGLLGCGAGEISGNNPIWLFGSGWPQQLGSPLSKHQARMAAIVTPLPWNEMTLVDALVTGGHGTGTAEVAPARTADRTKAIIYIPPSGAQTITVDLSQMAGATTATWHDPTTNTMMAAGSGLTGSKSFTTPGTNAAGDNDWVLVLSSP